MDRWSERRLGPIREMIEERKQELTELERDFIQPEFERLQEEIDNPETPHARRSWIGERLCALGDTRPGVGLTKYGLPDIVWLPVGGGQIEIKGKTFTVEPFLIAKYPITYLQFQAFVDAEDGFGNDTWWKGLAALDVHKNPPGEPRFKFDNHPRDSVSCRR